jgi:hypothetical protein
VLVGHGFVAQVIKTRASPPKALPVSEQAQSVESTAWFFKTNSPPLQSSGTVPRNTSGALPAQHDALNLALTVSMLLEINAVIETGPLCTTGETSEQSVDAWHSTDATPARPVQSAAHHVAVEGIRTGERRDGRFCAAALSGQEARAGRDTVK